MKQLQRFKIITTSRIVISWFAINIMIQSITAQKDYGYGTNQYYNRNSTWCTSKERTHASTINYLDSIIDLLWEELEGDIRNANSGIVAARQTANFKQYKAMAFIAIGSLSIVHSINLARDAALRACRNDICRSRAGWKPVRDISQTIGVPLYAFSFSNTRFRNVKPLKLGCGVYDLKAVTRRFQHLRRLHEFAAKLERINPYASHPLNQLGPQFLPEIITHQLEMFRFRMISAISCLLEDNNREANRVVRHINTLISLSKQKLRLLTTMLQNKISNFEKNVIGKEDFCS